MPDRASEIIAEWERRETDKVVFMTHWQEIANYLHPNRNDYITERMPGQKRMQYIYDATPVWANDQFAAGMHSLLTSPNLPWFYLEPDDEALLKNNDVRLWLEAVTASLYALFNSPRHNFASQSHELYLDLGSIGTATMAVLDSDKSGILFSTRHMKENNWAENDEDRIDSNIRKWEWTANQAWAQWGTAAGPAVAKAIDDGQGAIRKFRFLHSVQPRRNRIEGRADARNMAWESVWVAVDDKHLIREGGFPEFPYLCSRLEKATGEVYGRGRGTMALPDVKMLMEMKKTLIKAAQKVVDPPLAVPDSSFLMQIKTVPGSINYYRAGGEGSGVEPIETKGQIQLGIELMNAQQAQVIRTFYVDWLIMPSDLKDPASSGKGVTATYVLQQRDEKMRMLSPMLARLNSEFTDPLIDRTFAIQWRKSKMMRFGPGAPFPPPPAALSGVPLRVRYVSPIALAQKSAQMDGVTRLLQLQMQLKQIDPNMPTILDGEYTMRLAQRDWYAPVEVLKSTGRLQQEAQAKAQQIQAMQENERISTVADAAKGGASAVKNLAQAGGAAQPAQQAA